MAQAKLTDTPTATTAAPRPIANPGPLGLMGFGITTLVLSLVNSNLLGSNLDAGEVLPLALAFGGGAQLLAGMWEFHAGNTFGATAFTSYGAFWISFFFLVNNGFGDPKAAGTYGVATYLLGWTIFTLLMTIGAWRVSGALGTLFSLLFLTFLALTLGGYGIGSNLGQIGGYLGIVTALNAFYVAVAGILKDLEGKDVLPVFPVKR